MSIGTVAGAESASSVNRATFLSLLLVAGGRLTCLGLMAKPPLFALSRQRGAVGLDFYWGRELKAFHIQQLQRGL